MEKSVNMKLFRKHFGFPSPSLILRTQDNVYKKKEIE